MSSTPARLHSGPPPVMVWSVAVASTVVVLLAYGQLAFEVAELGKPWGPYVLRIVIMAIFWTVMMRAYVNASKLSMLRGRWWLFLIALAVLLGSMAVAVIYRMFVNVQAW